VESREPDEGGEPTTARDVAAPPRIDAVVFARRHEALGGRLPLSSMHRLRSAGVGDEGMLDWDVEGTLGRDEMQRQREFLRVCTRFSPWMTCSRCLEPVQVRGLSTDTRFRLAASEAQAAAEDREAESEEVIAADPNLDLAALVEDEAILALPMAPAHEDCDWKPRAGMDDPAGL
jgi:uncharacterized protein